jgi:quinoprotein relay system zinc metallohydrolase 2
MFEAVVSLCLALETGPCRDHLLPGYEAASETACRASLSADPPTLEQFAPLVPGGDPRCRTVGETLRFVEIGPGLFVHRGQIAEADAGNRGDVANIGVIVGQESVAVIDTGSARWMGEAVWRSVRARTEKPVSHVILTHMHPDHVFGATVLAEGGASVIGHAALPRALSDRQSNYLASLDRLIGTENLLGTAAARVDIAVTGDLEVDLGGRVLDLQAWPPAHTGTDLTVLDRATGTLFAGDLVFDDHVPALDGQLTGWRAALDVLQAQPLARVVPGHGGPVLDWPVGGSATARYLATLEADTRAAIDEGARLGDAVEEIAASEAARWALFEAYNARNATVAFTELEWE